VLPAEEAVTLLSADYPRSTFYRLRVGRLPIVEETDFGPKAMSKDLWADF